MNWIIANVIVPIRATGVNTCKSMVRATAAHNP